MLINHSLLHTRSMIILSLLILHAPCSDNLSSIPFSLGSSYPISPLNVIIAPLGSLYFHRDKLHFHAFSFALGSVIALYRLSLFFLYPPIFPLKGLCWFSILFVFYVIFFSLFYVKVCIESNIEEK